MKQIFRTTLLGYLAVLLLPSLGLADNPIAQAYYTPDPAPMVWNDTVFVYTGNDEGGSFFTMNNWRVYSSTDMVNWTDRGFVFGHESITNAKPAGDWAAECIYRNGKFYYYVTVESTKGGRAVAVGVADKPDGPFKEAYNRHMAGPNWDYIDPTVFVDDDDQAYIYWGNPKLYYAKLKEDMITIDGQINVTDMSRGFAPNGESSKYTEGPWIHKRGNKYYMIYASHGIPEKISYSWSDSPTGPWEWKGVILDQHSGFAFTSHAGIIEFKGRAFIFYHTAKLPGGGGYNRSTQVDEFTFNPDGTIPLVKPTDLGVVKPIHNLDPFKVVQAETKAFSRGIGTYRVEGKGVYVNKLDNNDYIKVRSVDFGDDGADKFYAAVKGGSGTIEIRLDKQDGEMIGQLNVTSANDFVEQSVDVSGAVGVHDLFFVFKGGTSMFEFDYWYFETAAAAIPQGPFCGVDKTGCVATPIPGKIEVENYDVGGSNKAYYDVSIENEGAKYREDRVDIVADEFGNYMIGYTEAGEWLEYTVNVEEAKAYPFRARVSSGSESSSFQLFLGDKAITDTIKIETTGDWDTYAEIEGTTSAISSGEQVLKLLITGSYVNIDWIEFGEKTNSISKTFDLEKQGLQTYKVFSLQGQYLGDIQSNSIQDCKREIHERFPVGKYVIRDSHHAYRVIK